MAVALHEARCQPGDHWAGITWAEEFPAPGVEGAGRLRPEDLAERSPNSAGLWQGVREAAAQMAAREPFLRSMVDDLVLSRPSPAEIVSAVLARRLRAEQPGGHGLRELMLDVLREDSLALEFIESDLFAVKARDPACGSYVHALLNLKGFQALQSHRLAHSLWKFGRSDLAHWLSNRTSFVLGVDIHPAVPMGKGVMLDHGSGIVIGETAIVEDDVSILQDVTLGGTGNERGDRHPKVRRGAMLGAGAKVLGNIEIGCMSRIGAGSVVVNPVPPYCTVAGVPAKVVRRRRPEDVQQT